jgi:hypothetical protein
VPHPNVVLFDVRVGFHIQVFPTPNPRRFWQKHFYDFNVRTEEKHREKLR